MTKYFLAVCLAIVTLSACQSTNQSSRSESSDRQATPAIPPSVGDTQDPALSRRYSNKEDRDLQTLLGLARQALEDQRTDQAVGILAQTSIDGRAAGLQDAFFRLSATAHRQQNDWRGASLALAQIKALRPADLSLFGQTCSALGDASCYVHSQVLWQQFQGAIQQQAQDNLWLALMGPKQVQAQGLEPTAPIVVNLRDQLGKVKAPGINHAQAKQISAGWLSLQSQIVSAGSITQAQQAWRLWQQTHPAHPATRQPPALLRRLDEFKSPNVSILLPLSGRLTNVANAIRDGFMAGYFADLQAQQRTDAAPATLAFLNSDNTDTRELLAQARANDSDVIVGPLVKSKAAELLAIQSSQPDLGDNFKPSLVLLNQVPDMGSGAMANAFVYQFAAAIEDEAFTLAEYLKAQGHHRLMLVTNDQPWSQRAGTALKENWRGSVAEANFRQTKDVTNVVGEAMGVAASQLRRDQLAALIGEDVEFLPRGREDLDAVVAFTDTLESKALVPALKFHFANDLPVYGTSQTARGSELGDLASFQITELPMLAQPNPLTEQVLELFALGDSRLLELYALGLDAYRLATWTHWLRDNAEVLPQGEAIELHFASGKLTLGSGGRIVRKLQITTVAQAASSRRRRDG